MKTKTCPNPDQLSIFSVAPTMPAYKEPEPILSLSSQYSAVDPTKPAKLFRVGDIVHVDEHQFVQGKTATILAIDLFNGVNGGKILIKVKIAETLWGIAPKHLSLVNE